MTRVIGQHHRLYVVDSPLSLAYGTNYCIQVAFTDTERLIGDAAKNQVAMNP